MELMITVARASWLTVCQMTALKPAFGREQTAPESDRDKAVPSNGFAFAMDFP